MMNVVKSTKTDGDRINECNFDNTGRSGSCEKVLQELSGKNPNGNVKYEEYFGKCAAPMVSMLDELPEELKPLPFRIYFDNLFTGVKLFVRLKNRGYGAIGTIRENRILKDCSLTSSKEMKTKTKKVNISNEGNCIVRKVNTREALIHRLLDAAYRIKTAASNSPERRAQFTPERNGALKQKEVPLKMCGNIDPDI
ncbi:hypothetical protein ANN_13800 [Periplaneta americana]|uniref:PiggyBac transposable element-derived protein domain-containing protein n=1 Tax=Periplaneta americana TaxID=6978 RepID=A0ABQ8SUJ0_PERAM|nr:hypothetical protein ANN_13800 [Periplaneta americana]